MRFIMNSLPLIPTVDNCFILLSNITRDPILFKKVDFINYSMISRQRGVENTIQPKRSGEYCSYSKSCNHKHHHHAWSKTCQVHLWGQLSLERLYMSNQWNWSSFNLKLQKKVDVPPVYQSQMKMRIALDGSGRHEC